MELQQFLPGRRRSFSSDRSVTLGEVPSKAPSGALETGAVCAEEEEQDVLRTHHGQRVFDAPEVQVLIELAEIRARVHAAGLRRRSLHASSYASSAAQEHLLACGHPLAFGCCRPRVVA